MNPSRTRYPAMFRVGTLDLDKVQDLLMNIVIMGDRQPYLAIVLVSVMRGGIIRLLHISTRISPANDTIFSHGLPVKDCEGDKKKKIISSGLSSSARPSTST